MNGIRSSVWMIVALLLLDLSSASADPPEPDRSSRSPSAEANLSAGVRSWHALNQRVTIDAVDEPLSDVVEQIAQQVGVTVDVADAGLRREGIDGSHPVNLRLDNVRAKSALRLLLKPLRLTMHVKHDGRVIVTSRRNPERFIIQRYDVRDILSEAGQPAGRREDAERTLKNLASLVTYTVSPDAWDEFGGLGSISVDLERRMLVIRQTPEIHADIAELMARVRRQQLAEVEPPETSAEDERICRQIEERLATTKLTISRQNVPLTDMVSEISRAADVNIVLDRYIREEGVTGQTLVSLDVKEGPIDGPLTILLESLNLDYVIENDVVLITSSQRALGEVTVIIYPVGPLLESSNDQKLERELATLAQSIRQEPDPEQWDDKGGIGRICTHPATRSLVIRQSEAIHMKIRAWIESKAPR